MNRKAPKIRQTWRFGKEEGVITRILPGGGDNLGIVEFDGLIAPAHVSTMMRFDSWRLVSEPPLPYLPNIDAGDGPPL